MKNKNHSKLPSLSEMEFLDWEAALMAAYDKGHIKFDVSDEDKISLSLGDVFISLDFPLVEEFQDKGEVGLKKMLNTYPARVIIGEFIHSSIIGCPVDMTTKLMYNLLAESANLPSNAICRLDRGDVMVDTKGKHYHVDCDGKKFRTAHDMIKARRDNSFGSMPEDNLNDVTCEYDEFCPNCNTENHGTLDTRVGLVGVCEECGEKHLICIMCDNLGWGCSNCPEEHLNAMKRY